MEAEQTEAKKRGRKGIEVTPAELQKFIADLETAQPDGKFRTRGELFEAIEDSQWAKTRSPRALSAQVARIMVVKNNLTLLTPLGQKGRVKGMPAPVVPEGNRKRKQIEGEALKALTQAVPKSSAKILAKAARGSLRAAIRIKCMDCSGEQASEVRKCAVNDCALWSFRPFQKGKKQAVAEGRRISLV